MADACFDDWPVPGHAIVLVAAVGGLSAAAVAGTMTGPGTRLTPAAVGVILTAGPLWWFRARHHVRVTADRLKVGGGWAGGFEVPLEAVERWRVLSREDAFEVRAALHGAGRVAFLPWLPAAAYLLLGDGRTYFVGTRRPEALRAALARVAPHREAVGDLARALEAVRAAEAVASAESDRFAAGSVTGGAAALLLGATAAFGALATLLVLDAMTRLPGGLGVIGAVGGPVVGALVVAEAASRTPLAPARVAALAAVCAGLAPPLAAAVGGASLTGAVFLALLTVPVAFATATLYSGATRQA